MKLNGYSVLALLGLKLHQMAAFPVQEHQVTPLAGNQNQEVLESKCYC